MSLASFCMFPGDFCLPSTLQAWLVKRPELLPSSCAMCCLQRLAPKPTSCCRSLGRLLPLSGSQFSICEMEAMKYNYYRGALKYI